MKLNDYNDYKKTVLTLIDDLKQISEINKNLYLEKNDKTVKQAIQRLENDTFNIAIVGEFNRGKSSVINALLGKKNVLPVSIMPCTASINKVMYGVKPNARIVYKDGTFEDIDLAEGSDILKQYLTKLTEESEARAALIREVFVNYPVEYCRNGVTIIDTPGLNDDTAMTDITLSVLPSADVAIMVLMAKAPYSQSENEFLENKILAGDLGKVLFVVNGIDQVESEEDKKRIIDEIRKRIETASLSKVKEVYGCDSKEYLDYKNKLGNLRIFGISARNAVKAKEEKNTELLKNSLFPEFEKELERFIVEERGVISLLNPINKIKTSSVEIMRSCAERLSALEMELNEFVDKCAIAETEIYELRKKQTKELARIEDAAQLSYQNLLPEINTFWEKIKISVNNTIENFYISTEDLTKEKIDDTQKRIISAVQKSLENTAQNKTELIKEYIIKDLQQETDRLSEFEKDFFEGIEKIQNCFVNKENLPVTNDSNALTATIMNYFAGAGGFYQGFKYAGWKGALVGGVAGLVGSYASAIGIGSLMLALSIPFSGPILVVGGILAALVGTFTGKWVLGKFFPSDKIERFKNAIKEAVGKEIDKLEKENDFSKKVKEQVDTMFDALKNKVKTETNNILDDTQNRLSKLKQDLTENKINKESEKEQLKQITLIISEMNKNVQILDGQIQEILKKGA